MDCGALMGTGAVAIPEVTCVGRNCCCCCIAEGDVMCCLATVDNVMAGLGTTGLPPFIKTGFGPDACVVPTIVRFNVLPGIVPTGAFVRYFGTTRCCCCDLPTVAVATLEVEAAGIECRTGCGTPVRTTPGC